MAEQSKLLSRAKGYEFWAHYDRSAEVYELFLDPDGETYIGEFDTIAEARAYIPQWLADQV